MAPRGDGAVQQGQTSDLQLLVDSAPSLIHTSRPDGHLDFFNQTWLRYVGQSLQDLEGWKWTEFIHPEDVDGIVERWRASLANGEPFLYEARVLRADGGYRWMLHHKVAIREPEDMTGAILFLTSYDAAFITGQAIVVDGGQYRIA